MATYSEKELKTVGNQNVLQSLKVLDPSFIILENNLAGSDPNATMNLNIGGNTNIVGLETEYSTNLTSLFSFWMDLKPLYRPLLT